MPKRKKRTPPFEIGDEVEFLMTTGDRFTGVIDCYCEGWVSFKDAGEIRLPYVIAFKIMKKADVAKEAQDFLAKEKCPDVEKEDEK